MYKIDPSLFAASFSSPFQLARILIGHLEDKNEDDREAIVEIMDNMFWVLIQLTSLVVKPGSNPPEHGLVLGEGQSMYDVFSGEQGLHLYSGDMEKTYCGVHGAENVSAPFPLMAAGQEFIPFVCIDCLEKAVKEVKNG